MKKAIFVLLLISIISTSAYALNPLERLAYKEVTLKSYNQKVLVNRITGKVQYRWQGPTAVIIYGEAVPDGQWIPIYDKDREMWQNIYDQENAPPI